MHYKSFRSLFWLTISVLCFLPAAYAKQGRSTKPTPWSIKRVDTTVREGSDAYYEQRELFAPEAVRSKLAELRKFIATNNLDFTVGYTSVSDMRIKEITGERELSEAERAQIKKELLSKSSRQLDRSGSDAPAYITINGISLSPSQARLDFRQYGLVTPIKNQNPAGLCWAFGSVATYETAYNLQHKTEIEASEQYVVNCSGAGDTSGGLALLVFKWMVENKRNLDSEIGFPYLATVGACPKSLPATDYFAADWGIVDPSQDPNATPTVQQIKDALCKYGVISASVYVSDLFQRYTSGILKDPAKYAGTNHAVAIIGWDDSKNAWLIKNSWGTGWGTSCDYGYERGYAWIDYGSNNMGRRACWIKSR